MRNKKKIVRTVTVSNSIDFFKEVIIKMKKDGYESVVVTSPGVFLDEFREENPEFKTIEVPMARHISLVKDFIALMRMIWVLSKERPYIVHSMTPKAGLLSMVAAKLTGVPVRIHTFTGLVWPTAVGNKRRILMLMDKILCYCATNIIPEGQGVLDDLKNNGVCKRPMRVLGYGNAMGVDMKRFDASRFSDIKKDESIFTFLFVGRIVGDKGINELVEAFTKLNDKYSKTRLVLVGSYEKILDPVNETTQQCIATNPMIQAVGTIHGDNLLKEYVKADCFVMPSYREGFPNTVLEAGAMGLPCIVTDINGSREIITNLNDNDNDNERSTQRGACQSKNSQTSEALKPSNTQTLKEASNGIVIPAKDVDSLYEAMRMMVENDEMREMMARNARPMIESRFEKSFVQSCQIKYYEEILNEKQ